MGTTIFEENLPQTMAFKGTDTVTIKSSGNEKNRFTVMLGAYGDGKKMRPYIIFKRKTLPKNVVWPSGVIVRCQSKGWMDEALTKFGCVLYMGTGFFPASTCHF